MQDDPRYRIRVAVETEFLPEQGDPDSAKKITIKVPISKNV